MQRSGDGDGLTVKLTGLELPAFRSANMEALSSTVDRFHFFQFKDFATEVATVDMTYTDAGHTVFVSANRVL